MIAGSVRHEEPLMAPVIVTLDALDARANAAFPGPVVRKDLVRRLRST
jgi:hypothetical protein